MPDLGVVGFFGAICAWLGTASPVLRRCYAVHVLSPIFVPVTSVTAFLLRPKENAKIQRVAARNIVTAYPLRSFSDDRKRAVT